MLGNKLKNYKIILASSSPRRQQLLKSLGLNFKVVTHKIDEKYPEYFTGTEITDYLAELKTKPFHNLANNELLIASDTIVWQNNKAIGKPKNKREAEEILKILSGKTHKVITSICIKTKLKTKIVNDITSVYFSVLTNEEINYYIENFNPYDKAGGYGIQDWIGYIGVEKIEGSFFNVMGLPVHKLYKELLNF